MEFTTAIMTVLKNSRKGDVREEVKYLKTKGYEVRKSGVKNAYGLEVYNPETGKWFYLATTYGRNKKGEYGYRYELRYATYGYYTKDTSRFDNINDIEKCFNFEKFLNTPYNKDYRFVKYYNENTSKAYQEYDRLKSKRWGVDYHTKEIERAKAEMEKQIAKLQRDILYHTEQLAKGKQELAAYKKEVGLTK